MVLPGRSKRLQAKIDGCSERGHGVGWYTVKVQVDDLLWQLLKG